MFTSNNPLNFQFFNTKVSGSDKYLKRRKREQ